MCPAGFRRGIAPPETPFSKRWKDVEGYYTPENIVSI
jgi:hypothetical protein